MFESQDVKEVGLRNISNAKLQRTWHFLYPGIYMLHGVAASMDVDAIKTTFDSIENVVSLLLMVSSNWRPTKKATGERYLNRKFRPRVWHGAKKVLQTRKTLAWFTTISTSSLKSNLGTITGLIQTQWLW